MTLYFGILWRSLALWTFKKRKIRGRRERRHPHQEVHKARGGGTLQRGQPFGMLTPPWTGWRTPSWPGRRIWNSRRSRKIRTGGTMSRKGIRRKSTLMSRLGETFKTAKGGCSCHLCTEGGSGVRARCAWKTYMHTSCKVDNDCLN